jgi:nucleoside-diphosphate-sugar epimerase|tara:strand:+ start:38234 stop:38947 length:714 start_codon:yes stop_codon:yes gene_type:complete
MKTISLIGYKGFVGSKISEELSKNTNYNLVNLKRGDDISRAISSSNIVIHSANPAKRFFANQNPELDYKETVTKTYDFLQKSINKKFILISSISCRTQLDTNYGRNRKSCELLVKQHPNFLILRLGPMFGKGRNQDVLHDILNDRKIYISADTKYSYANVSWVAKKIVSLLDNNNQIIEIGSKNSISLNDIKSHFKSKSIFKGFNDSQVAINNGDGPDVQEVIDFAKTIILSKKIIK